MMLKKVNEIANRGQERARPGTKNEENVRGSLAVCCCCYIPGHNNNNNNNTHTARLSNKQDKQEFHEIYQTF